MEILYGVSSVGLGHARRSLEIANELQKLGSYNITWVCADPARSFLLQERLRHAGKEREINIHPLSFELESLSSVMESQVTQGKLKDISLVARRSSKIGKRNYQKLKHILSNYDALIQDEFAESIFWFMWDKKSPPIPEKRVLITDYFFLETGSRNPIRRLVIWYANRMLKIAYKKAGIRLFVENISDQISSKEVLGAFNIVGPIVGQIPTESREELKRNLLGTTNGSVLVVTIGGTSIGRSIIDFIISNADDILKKLAENMTLVMLLGPRLDRTEYPSNSDVIKFVAFTTDSLSYFKAADCIITQAGASTMNEIASLGTPCVAIPIKSHWEQEDNAHKFSENCGFQIVTYDSLSVDAIVAAVKNAMKAGHYEPLKSDGAKKAAQLIHAYLELN